MLCCVTRAYMCVTRLSTLLLVVSHGWFTRVAWLICRFHEWHDPCISVTCLYVCHDWFICVTWHIHVRDDSCIRATHLGVMSHMSMGHATHMHGSCQRYQWFIPHIYTSHVTRMHRVMPHIFKSHVRHMNELCNTHTQVMTHTSMSHDTHINESCYTYASRHIYEQSHAKKKKLFAEGGVERFHN